VGSGVTVGRSGVALGAVVELGAVVGVTLAELVGDAKGEGDAVAVAVRVALAAGLAAAVAGADAGVPVATMAGVEDGVPVTAGTVGARVRSGGGVLPHPSNSRASSPLTHNQGARRERQRGMERTVRYG
jgi:hypothetical protein